MGVITIFQVTRLVSNKEKAFPIGKAFYILKTKLSAGNSADANLALTGSNLYSDVVLNVPLIRPNRALIPVIRTSWPEVGVASQRPKTEDETR